MSATKERPIPFSAPMVQALLAGTKTQTRRPVKGWALEWLTPPISFSPEYVAHPDNKACPYGQPGDRLWVREAFSGPHHQERHPPRDWHSSDPIHYWADGNPAAGDWTKPRPGMFMPRWASRITLEVTGVRVERLQDISAADALAEGIVMLGDDDGFGLPDGSHFHYTDPRLSYWSLWDAINGPGSVEANPWVWCVEFRRLS